MASYPTILAGMRITATLLQGGLPQVVLKTAQTSRSSTTTSTDDPELSGIFLGVGQWRIRTVLLTTAAVAAGTYGFKNRWGFTGTWSGARRCLGQNLGSTDPTNTQVRNIGSAFGTENAYGVPQTYSQPVEEAGVATVTVAGNFSIQWAQATSNANSTSINAGSFVEFFQLS